MLNHNLFLNQNYLSLSKTATRDGFGDAIFALAPTNPLIQVLTADLTDSLRLEKFANQLPNQFLQVGIAEQNLLGIAAGLAKEGLVPFATSYAVFSPGRNWDQLRVSICYSQANVKIVSSHAGLVTGPDGAVHQALEDIALTRVLPHLTVISPADYAQAYAATLAIATTQNPTYLRLSRAATYPITTATTPFAIGTNQILRFGESVTIVATGSMVAEALRASDQLNAEVINVHTIKPLDINSIIDSLNKTHRLAIIEDHQRAGGLGSAIFEALVQANYQIPPTVHLAVNDRFGGSGTEDELLSHYGLTADNLVTQIRQTLLK